MQTYPPPPPISTTQHLRAHETLQLYLPKGSQLLVLQGQARLTQPVWIAERMLMQRLPLAAGQQHLAECSAWVCLSSQTELSFTVTAPEPLLHTLRLTLAKRLHVFKAWLSQHLLRKTHHAQ
jgi:hypothetical protein